MTFEQFTNECVLRGLDKKIEEICRAHGVLPLEIFERTKKNSIHHARVTVWVWLIDECHKSPQEVADLFDRNRETVAYAADRWRLRFAKSELVSLAKTR